MGCRDKEAQDEGREMSCNSSYLSLQSRGCGHPFPAWLPLGLMEGFSQASGESRPGTRIQGTRGAVALSFLWQGWIGSSAAWLGLWEQQECPAEVGREVILGHDLVQVSQPEPSSHFIPSAWAVGYVTVGK